MINSFINSLGLYYSILRFPRLTYSQKINFLAVNTWEVLRQSIFPKNEKTFTYLNESKFSFSGIHKNLLIDQLANHVRYYYQYYRKAKVIVDVGASFGTFSYLSNVFNPTAKIYAFEMTPQSFNYLQKNCSDIDKVKLINKAVGESTGTVKYHVEDAFLEGARIAKPAKGTKFETVDQISLDDYFKDNLSRGTVAKIDTEGNELNVLRGFTKNLSKCDYLIVETDLKMSNLTQVLKLLETSGFCLVSTGDANWDYNGKVARISSVDLIFSRNND